MSGDWGRGGGERDGRGVREAREGRERGHEKGDFLAAGINRSSKFPAECSMSSDLLSSVSEDRMGNVRDCRE